MMNICRFRELRLNIHRLNMLRLNTHRHNTLNLEEVDFFKVEDEEEYLAAKEAKSFLIIMDSLDIFLDIALILR